VEFLDRKLAQAEEQDRLRAFLMALPTDHISEEASAYHAFIEWARRRLEKMEFQLQLATIAAEVSRMEAFVSGSAIDNTRD
jgi:lysine/ornithine N-monooxygenase